MSLNPLRNGIFVVFGYSPLKQAKHGVDEFLLLIDFIMEFSEI